MVSASTSVRSPTLSLTKANSAMSQQNATSVRKAARKEISEEIKVTVTCVEKEKRNAMKVTAAAIGVKRAQKLMQ